MPRIKSLLTSIDVDEAQKAHNCQGNGRHRLERGAKRLKVRNGRTWDHYCLECARIIISRDITALKAIAQQLEEQMRSV